MLKYNLIKETKYEKDYKENYLGLSAAVLLSAASVASFAFPAAAESSTSEGVYTVQPGNIANIKVVDEDGNFVNGVDVMMKNSDGTEYASWKSNSEISDTPSEFMVNIEELAKLCDIKEGIIEYSHKITSGTANPSNQPLSFEFDDTQELTLSYVSQDAETVLTVEPDSFVFTADEAWADKSIQGNIYFNNNVDGTNVIDVPAGEYTLALGNIPSKYIAPGSADMKIVDKDGILEFVITLKNTDTTTGTTTTTTASEATTTTAEVTTTAASSTTTTTKAAATTKTATTTKSSNSSGNPQFFYLCKSQKIYIKITFRINFSLAVHLSFEGTIGLSIYYFLKS